MTDWRWKKIPQFPCPLGSTTPKQCIYQAPHMSSAGLSPRCQKERLLRDTRCRVLAPSLRASLPQLPSVFPGTPSLYNCPEAALRTCTWGDWMKIRDQPLLSCGRFLRPGRQAQYCRAFQSSQKNQNPEFPVKPYAFSLPAQIK